MYMYGAGSWEVKTYVFLSEEYHGDYLEIVHVHIKRTYRVLSNSNQKKEIDSERSKHI